MEKVCAFRPNPNGDWNLLRKFWNLHRKIAMGNWRFSIFYPIFLDICHFIQLCKITPFFYNHFLGFGGGGSFPPPGGRPCVSQHVIPLRKRIRIRMGMRMNIVNVGADADADSHPHSGCGIRMQIVNHWQKYIFCLPRGGGYGCGSSLK